MFIQMIFLQLYGNNKVYGSSLCYCRCFRIVVDVFNIISFSSIRNLGLLSVFVRMYLLIFILVAVQ